MFAAVRQLRLTERNIGGADKDDDAADPGPYVWYFAKHQETERACPK